MHKPEIIICKKMQIHCFSEVQQQCNKIANKMHPPWFLFCCTAKACHTCPKTLVIVYISSREKSESGFGDQNQDFPGRLGIRISGSTESGFTGIPNQDRNTQNQDLFWESGFTYRIWIYFENQDFDWESGFHFENQDFHCVIRGTGEGAQIGFEATGGVVGKNCPFLTLKRGLASKSYVWS